MSPRILPLVCLLGACTIPSVPAPEPLPPPPPRPITEAAEPATVAVNAPTVAADAAPEAVAAPPARVHPPETVALFVANCAQCHGEKGDGEGVTQLDRKARSFLDGGFSYGNTPDAIFRSITHGIPGTPMPGFEKPLNEAQRRVLADYVIALGPEREPVDTKAMEMVVKDRAVVVRGKLPALVEGGPEFPRGLAIGTPDGLTFEYRVDDVQLLAVRAGPFVNRTDWGERGGQPLEMLGKAIWVAPAERRAATLTIEGAPATCHILASEVRGPEAWLEYDARGSGGADSKTARVRETVQVVHSALGAGFARRFVLRAEAGTRIECFQASADSREGAVGNSLKIHGDQLIHARRSSSTGSPTELIAVVTRELAVPGPSERGLEFAMTSNGKEQEFLLLVLPSIQVLDEAQYLELLARGFE